ncbi:Cell surface glycoprotein CD200 receptor 1-A [Aix galericulata]|nr:Cell surface glycoprotein CD200 receptor 1-A [Aix galericulata]
MLLPQYYRTSGTFRSLGRAVALTAEDHWQGMRRISQQARWCRRPAPPRHARAALEEIWKTIYTVVLLTITAVTGATGNRTAAQVGHSAVMTCPHRTGVTMVMWKISPKIGGPCTLVFRADQNRVDRTNCSDSVKMPPRLSLYCENHSYPVCEAAAGRPAAEISWVPENNSTTEIDSHDNGTVTVLSRFTAHSTDRKTVTCKVYHATLNETMSTDCSSSQAESKGPYRDLNGAPGPMGREWNWRLSVRLGSQHRKPPALKVRRRNLSSFEEPGSQERSGEGWGKRKHSPWLLRMRWQARNMPHDHS